MRLEAGKADRMEHKGDKCNTDTGDCGSVALTASNKIMESPSMGRIPQEACALVPPAGVKG